MEPVRFGLVGLGNMGRSHLKKEAGLAEAKFVAVADVVAGAVEAATSEYGLRGFARAEDLIDSGECEAVLIATPHPFHPDIAIYAASRGLHVLCEKPIAVTVRSADAMIEAARANGVLLGLMFQTRTEPVYRRARALLDEGVIGPVYRVTLTASSWYRSQAYYDSGSWRGTWSGEGGGVLMNQAPHSLDMLVWLGGLPTRVVADVQTRWHRIEVEDTVSALLDYGDGKTGLLYTTTAEWPGINRYEICGERGKLVIEDGALRLYRLGQSLPEEIATGSMWSKPSGAWEDVPVEPTETGHAVVVRQFARAIRLGEAPIATGEDGLRALEPANALLLSGFRRQPVALPVDRAEYDAFLAEMCARAGAMAARPEQGTVISAQ
ncbi:MAG: Gfo/Idh/MocA family oxidoreductase [Chloroflexi bacterium]|nr:Gfo/Idh/MocA family oxidoreductase [Chloroflexota bacterium]